MLTHDLRDLDGRFDFGVLQSYFVAVDHTESHSGTQCVGGTQVDRDDATASLHVADFTLGTFESIVRQLIDSILLCLDRVLQLIIVANQLGHVLEYFDFGTAEIPEPFGSGYLAFVLFLGSSDFDLRRTIWFHCLACDSHRRRALSASCWRACAFLTSASEVVRIWVASSRVLAYCSFRFRIASIRKSGSCGIVAILWIDLGPEIRHVFGELGLDLRHFGIAAAALAQQLKLRLGQTADAQHRFHQSILVILGRQFGTCIGQALFCQLRLLRRSVAHSPEKEIQGE